jgi:hypothetical protein
VDLRNPGDGERSLKCVFWSRLPAGHAYLQIAKSEKAAVPTVSPGHAPFAFQILAVKLVAMLQAACLC